MKSITLEAKVRDISGKKVKSLRKQGILPAGVFGHNVKSVSLSVVAKDFNKVYKQAGETGLVELKYGDVSQHTLIADVQIHPLTRELLHIQFHAVNLLEKIKANVPLELVGDSPAVANNIGLLLQTLNEVEVEALPTDLPEKIDVEVATLSEVNQQVLVSQLTAPKGVEILTGAEEVVVKVAPLISEEAKKEAEEAAAKEAAAATTTEAAATTTTPATEGETSKPEAAEKTEMSS